MRYPDARNTAGMASSTQHPAADLHTMPQVARRLNVTERQAEWAAKRSRVEPVCRVGIIRLYDLSAIEQIAATVRDIASRREVVHA